MLRVYLKLTLNFTTASNIRLHSCPYLLIYKFHTFKILIWLDKTFSWYPSRFIFTFIIFDEKQTLKVRPLGCLIPCPHILVVGNSEWANSIHCHQYVWANNTKEKNVGSYELAANGRAAQLLQPVAAVAKKSTKRDTLLVGAYNWPPHQHVWAGY